MTDILDAPDPVEYELLVKELLERQFLGPLNDVQLKVSHRQSYPGSSGHNHVIDVSAEFRIAGVRILVLVECKCLRRKVEVSDVLEFAARIVDIGAHKGIIASTCGFQIGAKKVASNRGIACVQVIGRVWHDPSPDAAVYGGDNEKHRQRVLQARFEASRAFFSHTLRRPIERLSDERLREPVADCSFRDSLHVGFFLLPSVTADHSDDDVDVGEWWPVLRGCLSDDVWESHHRDKWAGLAVRFETDSGTALVVGRARGLWKIIVTEMALKHAAGML